jgi:peptidylprolyl isomerase
MHHGLRSLVVVLLFVGLTSVPRAEQAKGQARPAAPAGPMLVLDTSKGTVEIELFPNDAPKSVAHILELVKQSFYRGLRFHRVTPTLAQFGDPQTRNMTQRNAWGTGGSGKIVGAAEISKTRKHVRGTVALANSAGPASSDSQIYIMKAASPSLDGKYIIIGQVTKGMDVVDKIAETDLVKNLTLKPGGGH